MPFAVLLGIILGLIMLAQEVYQSWQKVSGLLKKGRHH